MTKSALDSRLPWQDLLLCEAEVVSLRLRGNMAGGLAVQIRYDLGTVSATVTDSSAQQVTSRILDQDELTVLLEALRKQSQKTPRLKLVSASALHAFVSALAISLYSSGPIPFGAAAFGNVISTSDNHLVGELDLGSQTRATITDANGGLSYEIHMAGRKPGVARRLTVTQLRTLITALRIYLVGKGSAANPLWQRILGDAVKRDDALRTAGR
jgi:hypothetical protein